MLSIVEIDESNRDYWDKEIVKFKTTHPLNAFGWGKVRSVDGWTPTYLMAKRGDSVTGAVMILTKHIPLTGLSIMYAPRGPVFNISDKETLRALLERIRMEARKSHAIFLRIDPNITEDAILKNGDPFINEGFIQLKHRWSFWNAPRDVYRIDLTKFDTEDELFKSLDRQARKAVRRAKKQAVTIQHAKSFREFDIFYKIFREFTIEKGFMSRSHAYQKCLWQEFVARGRGKLFLAVYRGQIVGGLICLVFAQKCLGMHMGTPYKYQYLRTNDAYVWEGIRWAKENGCSWFSFRGAATPTQERFKRKFKPEVKSLAGYYDLPFRSFFYRFFYFVESSIVPSALAAMIYVRKIFNRIEKR